MVTKDIKSSAYGDTQLEVVVLPEGSFFGELPAMLGIRSIFGMKTVIKTKGDKHMVNGIEHTMVYELETEFFKELLNDYPDVKNSIYVKGELRTAYFKHLATLRQGEFGYNMKVVEMENQLSSQESVTSATSLKKYTFNRE